MKIKRFAVLVFVCASMAYTQTQNPSDCGRHIHCSVHEDATTDPLLSGPGITDNPNGGKHDGDVCSVSATEAWVKSLGDDLHLWSADAALWECIGGKLFSPAHADDYHRTRDAQLWWDLRTKIVSDDELAEIRTREWAIESSYGGAVRFDDALAVQLALLVQWTRDELRSEAQTQIDALINSRSRVTISSRSGKILASCAVDSTTDSFGRVSDCSLNSGARLDDVIQAFLDWQSGPRCSQQVIDRRPPVKHICKPAQPAETLPSGETWVLMEGGCYDLRFVRIGITRPFRLEVRSSDGHLGAVAP